MLAIRPAPVRVLVEPSNMLLPESGEGLQDLRTLNAIGAFQVWRQSMTNPRDPDDAAMRRAATPLTSAPQGAAEPAAGVSIRTPDQRVRVFVSSTLEELAPERAATREA
ncbi:MAG: hypothetical protein JWO42_2447, partial [Chloroflexi bacterium]|nr:hypothetical protein [Chloroflexota bacterium]